MPRIGVLMIGSLFWDDAPLRVAWRRDRLGMVAAVPATAPIRYGRQSDKRRHTGTMVFSRRCPDRGAGGRGMIAPCRREARTPDDLLEEAVALWRAEADDVGTESVAAAWGAVAALPNPRGGVPASWLDAWRRRHRAERVRPRFDPEFDDEPSIDDDGLLAIDWPADPRTGEPVEFDLLLATPTVPRVIPSARVYPSPERIARAWIERGGGHERYFFRSVACGIRTFQDSAIWAAMREIGATWLEDATYRDAIAVLEREVPARR